MKALECAEAIVRTQGERFFEAGLWCLRGELTLASGTGREALAEDCFRRGLEVARQQRTKSWELRLCTRLGALLQGQGRSSEALQLLQPLYDAFTEGRETADLRAARALLDELTLVGGAHGREGDDR
jgi:predicted ATPase